VSQRSSKREGRNSSIGFDFWWGGDGASGWSGHEASGAGGGGGGGLGLTQEGMRMGEGEKIGVVVTTAPFNGAAGEGR
jgi:hypothetical protein